METIYLVGTSGYPNFGDEFIAAAWLKFLAEQRPDADVVLDCVEPGQATHLFEGLHPRLRVTDTLWRLVREVAEMEPSAALSHVDHRIAHLGTPRFDIGLVAARRASTIHFIGGGHLAGVWPHHRYLLRAGVQLRELAGARLVATGLGLTPAAEPEAVASWLRAFDHVSVRDRPSAEVTGFPRGPDDAFLAVSDVGLDRALSSGEKGDVWVCLQRDLVSDGVFDAIVGNVRDLLTSEEYVDRTVHYVEAIPGVDRHAYDRLSDLIPEERFVPFTRLWAEGLPAHPGQSWLTTRFHFHLLAAAKGADGVAFEINDDYYRVKHQSLVDLGTGWVVVPPGGSEGRGARRAADPTFAQRLGRRKRSEAQRLYPARTP